MTFLNFNFYSEVIYFFKGSEERSLISHICIRIEIVHGNILQVICLL